MNQKGHSRILLLVILFLLIIGGVLYFKPWNIVSPQQRACTSEAKICPDGSTVGRTGPECEFTACPNNPIPIAYQKIYTDPTNKYSFQLPSGWQTNIQLPTGINRSIFGSCDLYIYNPAFPSAVIVLEVLKQADDGGYCWSEGNFFKYGNRPTTTGTPISNMVISKWQHLNEETWRGDYFQFYTFFDKSTTVGIALLNQSVNITETEKAFDQILSTFKFTN